MTGGLAGPPLTHWLNEGAIRKKRLAEKLEELICILYEHKHWLSVLEGIRLFERQEAVPPSPLPKAIAIVAIDFPQFSLAMSELDVLAGSYEKWIVTAAQKKLSGNSNFAAGFNEVFLPYREKLGELVDDLKTHARAGLR